MIEIHKTAVKHAAGVADPSHHHWFVGNAAMELGSIAVISGAFSHFLPDVATLLAIVWYGVQISESWLGGKIKRWLNRRK
jgi:hypothetical protein